MLELLKIVVQPVILERGPDGRPVGERNGDPAAIYRADQLAGYMEALETELASYNAQNGGPPVPVQEATVLHIVCDNPACPGHPGLDPADRAGWMFCSFELYGDPTQQWVFGSYECMGQYAMGLAAPMEAAAP